jgi:hypothetical protein
MKKDFAHSKKTLTFFILALTMSCSSSNVCAIRKPVPRAIALIPALILLYSNIYLHELGHKYTAKILTGADSDIHIELLSGYTEWNEENSQLLKAHPKSQIATCLAGPMLGALGGYAVYALASLLPEKSAWRYEMQHNGQTLVWMNLLNLLPVNLFGRKLDGYLIWEIIQEMKNIK